MHPIRLFLFSFFCCFTASLWAQDWAPIHPDRTYHYRAESGVLLDQTIFVDSTYLDGSSEVWVFNPITRDCDTCWTGSIWINQPTIFGGQVESTANGAFLFLGQDEMLILPEAEVGTTWLASSNTMVEATVTSASQETVLGQIDSVKVISFSTGDSLILSKSFGVIWGMAMPPYEAEYYELVGVESPEAGLAVPDFFECFEFEVGDVFQYRNIWQWLGDQNEELLKLTVLSKEIFADSIQYDARRVSRTRKTTNFGYPVDTTYIEDTIKWVFRRSEWAWTDAYHRALVENSIDPDINGDNISMVVVEEEDGVVGKSVGSGDFMNGTYEPHPTDSSVYVLSPFADTYVRDVATGLGQTNYYLWIFEASESSDLIGYVKGGDTTGIVFPDEELLTKTFSRVQVLDMGLEVFPNPTSDHCQVAWDKPVQEPLDVFLMDGTGRMIDRKTAPRGSTSLSFSLEAYPAGVFQVVLVRQSGTAKARVVKQ
jgi:hypothetical protein